MDRFDYTGNSGTDRHLAILLSRSFHQLMH
jgi:hypothetical protein